MSSVTDDKRDRSLNEFLLLRLEIFLAFAGSDGTLRIGDDEYGNSCCKECTNLRKPNQMTYKQCIRNCGCPHNLLEEVDAVSDGCY